MKSLTLTLIFFSSLASAWECNENNGVIEKQDVIKISEKCTEAEPEFCVIFVSAPHNVDDRAFQHFTIRHIKNNNPLGVFEISSTKMGAEFKAEFSIEPSVREYFEITAFYSSFSHGCPIASTKLLSEI